MTLDIFGSLLNGAVDVLSLVLDSFSPIIFFVAGCCVIGAALSFIRFAITLRG